MPMRATGCRDPGVSRISPRGRLDGHRGHPRHRPHLKVHGRAGSEYRRRRHRRLDRRHRRQFHCREIRQERRRITGGRSPGETGRAKARAGATGPIRRIVSIAGPIRRTASTIRGQGAEAEAGAGRRDAAVRTRMRRSRRMIDGMMIMKERTVAGGQGAKEDDMSPRASTAPWASPARDGLKECTSPSTLS